MAFMQQLVSFGGLAIPLTLLVPFEQFNLGVLARITLLLLSERRRRALPDAVQNNYDAC
jgi:hypothetical protein